MAIFREAKKYSPGANCKNFTPIAGAWNMRTISLTSAKHKTVARRKNIRGVPGKAKELHADPDIHADARAKEDRLP